MWANGWKRVLIAGLMLAQAASSPAQEEPENLSKLDRLPTWHPTCPSSDRHGRSSSVSPDATEYTTLDDLLRQQTSGRRVESLLLTGPTLGPNAYKLSTLLRNVRVLTLQYLTTGQADSVLNQVRDWSRLERLTIDIAYPGPDRRSPNRLVSLPTMLQRFRKLRDLRIKEDGLNWSASMPVLAGMKALRRLEIDCRRLPPKVDDQPVLTTLRRLTALRLSGDGWQLRPELVSGLSGLTELDLQSLHVGTEQLQETLNQLPALETFRMAKCWQVQRLSFAKLDHLKAVELAYNDVFSVDAALLMSMPYVSQLTIKGGLTLDLTALGSLSHLRCLNVMGNRQSARLPEDVHTLRQLTDLRIYDVRLGSLPRSFGLLPRLQTLHLNQCSLDSLPATFGQLKTLRDLKMYGNELHRLPDLHGLKSLRSLHISGAQLITLPESIGRLTKLTALNVSENQLTEIPASITRLTKLKYLVAEHNRLDRLPDALGQLVRLKGLAVGANQLRHLPASLSQLTSLTGLSVDYNQLESLPDDIGNLRQLRFVSLANNQLTTLPNSLGQLDSLRYLWVGTNRLRTLPASVGQLRSLTSLAIDDNELTELPDSIGNLQQLTHLSLIGLPIVQLPTSVGSMRKLRSLTIQDTKLQILPESIGALINLDYVRLTNNELRTLPNSIGGWQAVTTFELREHALERLPNGVGRMRNLTELIIAGTNQGGALKQLPDSIIQCDWLQTLIIENHPQLDAADVFGKAARLKNLSNLSVVNCNVAQLPNVDWKAVSWKKLTIVQNSLTELPIGLLDAPTLQFVNARQNPFLGTLNQDFNGRQALLSAFMEAEKLSPTLPNAEIAEALLRVANKKGSAGDWAGAVNTLSKAIESAPDSMRELPFAERSSLYYAHKQYNKALNDLDSAIHYAPKLHYRGLHSPSILRAHWKWKGYINAEMGRYYEALSSLAQAERLLPANPLPRYAESIGSNEMDRARYLTLQGKLSAAETSYRKAIDAYEQAQQRSYVGIRLSVVEVCLLTGQYDRAEQLLNNLSEKQHSQLKNGYDVLHEYLRQSLQLLNESQTGSQATANMDLFLSSHSSKLAWRFTLTDTWLTYRKVNDTLISNFRQLQNLVRSQLVDQ